MAVKVVVAVVGGVLILVGLLAVGLPILVDDNDDVISCGSALTGLIDEPGYWDSGDDLEESSYMVHSAELRRGCVERIDTRRAWCWPVGGVGVVVVAGSLLFRSRSRGWGA